MNRQEASAKNVFIEYLSTRKQTSNRVNDPCADVAGRAHIAHVVPGLTEPNPISHKKLAKVDVRTLQRVTRICDVVAALARCCAIKRKPVRFTARENVRAARSAACGPCRRVRRCPGRVRNGYRF